MNRVLGGGDEVARAVSRTAAEPGDSGACVLCAVLSQQKQKQKSRLFNFTVCCCDVKRASEFEQKRCRKRRGF